MAVTMAAPTQPRDSVYERLEERVLSRDQIGASEIFYDLVRDGRPIPELVRETVRIHAPYTHVPFHQRNDSGDIRFVNNDHCLLSMRAALQLQRLVPDEATSFLPMAQTIWYIPTGLDPWNQLLGKAPGHYNRLYQMQLTGSPIAPVAHWVDGAPVTGESSSLQERLDRWLTLVMHCQVEEAYRTFLGLLENPADRQQVLAQLMFAGLIDVQDRTVFRLSFTTGHRAYRARATIELAETVGWENAHDILYAGVLDLGVGPHWYSLYEMACTFSRVVLQGQDVAMRTANTKALTRAEVKQTVDVVLHGNEVSVVRHIGGLLTAGTSIASIVDAIQLAATENILECGTPAAYNMPMHAYEYCNTVRWFYDNFDHPHQAKLLFVAGSFVNEVSQGQQAWPGNGPRDYRAPRGSRAWSDRQLLQKIDDAIVALRPDDAVSLTHAYLQNGYDTQPLVSILALACSKMGNDPHNQEISLVQLEDFGRNSHAARGRLLMGAAAHAAGHRKYGDPLEAYRRYAQAFGISTREDARGDAPVAEALLDD
ncbi:MAG: hypothetical protein IT305_23475 [Chloroflexi bacterium]|nr:hypothetical protein [Chloroflexota bacterium]